LSRTIKITLLVLLALTLFVSQLYWDMESYFHPDRIQSWLENAGALAPLVYILVMALAIIVSPIPSLPLDIAAGAFFGPLLGTIYSLIGALAGAVISFTIARLLGREVIERFLGGHVNFCPECSDRLLTRVVFISRLLPVISFDVVSYGAGLTRMSISRFALATFFGMIPLTFVYNYFGSVLVFGKWVSIPLGIIMVILFFLLPRWLEEKGFFRKKHDGS